MNVADARRVASALEQLGYESTGQAEDADVVVMVTCVVRKSAEDRAYGRLQSLQPLKRRHPKMVINLMGCMVGFKNNHTLKEHLPFVDVFSAPSDPQPLIEYLLGREGESTDKEEIARRFQLMDSEIVLPQAERGRLVSTFVTIMNGCSQACAYCIVPYRRGAEHSRNPEEIEKEVQSLVKQGVREVTLLGQIVDRYGSDLPDYPDLSTLLRRLHATEGLERLRFLTSHPRWMTDELLKTVAELPKVMPHIEVPVQSGDDQVLKLMRRGYTVRQYRDLIERIRNFIPNVSIATDIIVGFPGESEEAFQRTYDLLAELKLDVVHLARYSVRPGTLASREMKDDVSEEEKWCRFRLLEDLQKEIDSEINTQYKGETVSVLFENCKKGRWVGRTPTNKLVFVETKENILGKVIPIEITWTSPWSMRGNLKTVSAVQHA